MKFQYNRAVEACAALFVYASWDRQTDFMRSRNMTWPEEILAWKTETDTRLPDLMKPMVSELVSEFMLFFFSLLKLAVKDEITTVPGLIKTWQNLDDADLTELMIGGESFSCSASELLRNPTLGIQEILGADGTTRPGEENRFYDFLCHPGAYRESLSILLQEFYRAALHDREDDIAALMTERVSSDAVLFRDNPEDFCMSHMKMNKPEDNTACFISWFNCWDVVSQSDPSFIVYGRNSHRHREGTSPEDVYNLLNDETRRQIIKMLSRRDMYTRELSVELGITSATVSYHMTRMFGLGLIYQKPGERKRIYHCLKKDRLDQLFEVLKNELVL